MPLRTLIVELRLAARRLVRARAFAAIAIVSLALSIGAVTAVFSIFDTVLLRMLPVRNPSELVGIVSPEKPDADKVLSYPMYCALRDRNTGLSGLAVYAGASLALTLDGSGERVQGELVSGNYFDVLGVVPSAGRLIAPSDDRVRMGHPVAVLSYGLWQRRFGGDPGVVGAKLAINGHPFTIIGVAPQRFSGTRVGTPADLFLPLAMQLAAIPGWDDALDSPWTWWLHAVGRVKPGVPLPTAEAQLATLYKSEQRIPPEFANDPVARRIAAEDRLALAGSARGISNFRSAIAMPLRVLMWAVGVLMLLACVNLAGLLIARSAARRRDMAVRLALGAGRARLALESLAESAVLAFAGGALGVLISYAAKELLLTFLPPNDGVALQVPLDWRVLGFAAAASCATAVLASLLPALASARSDVAPALKQDGGSLRFAGVSVRKMLVAAQVALSVVLLAGATLFIRTLINLRSLDPGFRTSRLVTLSVDPLLNGYDRNRAAAVLDRIVEHVRQTPGVESAALATYAPFVTAGRRNTITIEGFQPAAGERVNVNANSVSPGFFETLGMPLLAGRTFDSRERDPKGKRVIINEAFARKFWPGGQAVGKRIGMGPNRPTEFEIVGVVRDGRWRDLRKAPEPALFLSAAQQGPSAMTLHVRTSLPSEAAMPTVRKAVAAIDPGLTVYNLSTVEQQLQRSLVRERMMASLSASFAGIALLLSALGLYGLLAYSVTRRIREIAIRVALGASRPSVVALIARESASMIGIGLIVGLSAAFALSRYVGSLLFGVETHQLSTYAAAAGALLAAGLAATLWPARQALRIDPASALRRE